QSRALRMLLAPIVELSEYPSTPAEEMPEERRSASSTSSPVAPVQATAEQRDEVKRLVAHLTGLRPDTDWQARCREITGGPAKLMTVTIANVLIDKLGQHIEAAEQFGRTEETT